MNNASQTARWITFLALIGAGCAVEDANSPGHDGSLVDPSAETAGQTETSDDTYGVLKGIEYRIPTDIHMVDGAQYLHDLYVAQDNHRMVVDMGDDRAFQAVVDRYAFNGVTKADFPALYASLELQRAQWLGLVERPPATPGDGVNSFGEFECDADIKVQNVSATGTAGGAAEGSCLTDNNVNSYSNTIGMFKAGDDQTVDELVASDVGIAYGANDAMKVTAEVEVNVNVDAHTLLAYNSLDNIVDQYNTSKTTYIEKWVHAGRQWVWLDHPTDLTDADNTSSDDNAARACIRRGVYNSPHGSNLDCDYALVDSTGHWTTSSTPSGMAAVDPVASAAAGYWVSDPDAYWAFGSGPNPAWTSGDHFLPMRGQAELTYHKQVGIKTEPVPGFIPVDFMDHVSASAYLVRGGMPDIYGAGVPATLNGGGFCTATNDPNDAFAMNFSQGYDVDPFDRSLLNFDAILQFRGHCSGNGVDTSLRAFVTLPIFEKLDQDGYGLGREQFVTVALLADTVEFRWSCFTPGTHVLLADDSEINIEDVKVGDQVITNLKGDTLTVVGLTRGQETESVFTVVDDLGHHLTMTAGHPVVLADGSLTRAGKLLPGDLLVSEEGLAEIVSVKEVPYYGPVYNLQLGTPEELLKIDDNDTTMFADGLLMGDQRLQGVMDERDIKRQRQPKAAPGWDKDLDSWKQLQARRAQ